MTSRSASTLSVWALAVLLLFGAGRATLVQATQPDAGDARRHRDEARAAADARKLAPAGRESFIKSCMTPHRSRALSHPGSQPKANP